MAQSMQVDDDGGFRPPGGAKEPKWDENITWFQFPDDNMPYKYRLVGKPVYYYTHWVSTKKKDGTPGKAYPEICKNYDSLAGKFDDKRGCKVCEFYQQVNKLLGAAKVPWASYPARIQKISAKATLASNAIIREIQEQGPPAAGAAKWTYIRPLRISSGVAKTIMELAMKFNAKPGSTKESPQFWGFNHPEKGRDLEISFNGNEKEAGKMYIVQRGDPTPLTADEMGQVHHLVDFQSLLKYTTDDKVAESLERNGYYDYLQSLQASQSLGLSIPAGAEQPTQNQVQTAPPQTQQVQSVPSQPSAPPREVPSAFQADDTPLPIADDLPPTAAANTKATSPAAPPVQVAVQPVAGGTLEAKVLNFANSNGMQTVATDKDYPEDLGMRFVKTGVVVPACFSSYSEKMKDPAKICKQCPVKLDCMLVD